jgi:phage baseplate assembly protein W
MTEQSVIRARQSIYSDLDFRFILNPNTGDIALKKDAEAIKQSIMNILMTSRGERPFNPEFGGNLRAYLFENFDVVTQAAMESVIVNSLRNYEPRVRVDNIVISDLSYRNALNISIDFTILSPEERREVVEFVVERIR